MINKNTLSIVITLLTITLLPIKAFSQENSYSIESIIENGVLPYSKLLKSNHTELKNSGFKYKKSKNLFQVKNHSTNTILSKLFYFETRSQTDYEMYIYMGENSPAVIQIFFYDAILFEALKKWIDKNDLKTYNVKARRAELIEFRYDTLKVSLAQSEKKYYKFIGESSLMFGMNWWGGGTYTVYPSIAVGSSYSRSSYPVYIYTIITPNKPVSKWYDKKVSKLKKHSKKDKQKSKKPTLTQNL